MNDKLKEFEKSYLSQNLKALSERRNISISRLANKVNINTSTLHNYFHGVYPRNILSLIRLARYFDVNLEDLLSKSLDRNRSYKQEKVSIEDFEINISIKKN